MTKTPNRFMPGNLFALLATLFCFAGGAAAQQPPAAATYGVVSLLGNQFTVVQATKQVGTNRDPNRYDVYKLDEKAFDTMIGGAVLSAIEKAEGSKSTLVRVDPALYPSATTLADERADIEKVALSIAETPLPATGAQPQRIIVIAPYRAEPHLKLRSTTVGHGKVAGLGFYVDGMTKTRRGDTGEKAQGYLGVFANFWVILIDPVTKKVVDQQRVTAGRALSAARSSDGDPWNVLTLEQKVDAIQKMAGFEIRRVLEAMLKK